MHQEFQEIEEQVMQKLLVFAEQIKELLARNVKEVLRENNVVATGDLLKSVDGKVERGVNSVLVEIFTGMGYDIYVHEGTKPHFPPIWKIRDWVVRKGLATRALTRGKNKGKVVRLTSSASAYKYKNSEEYYNVDKIARAVAWKIYKKGTKGIKFFELALKQATPQLESKIAGFKVS